MKKRVSASPIVSGISLGLMSAILMIWLVSLRISIGKISLGFQTSMYIANGHVQLRRIYVEQVGPDIPMDVFLRSQAVQITALQPPMAGISMFGFVSDQPIGLHVTMAPGQMALISPGRYWILWFPIWVLLIPLAVVAAISLLRWDRARENTRHGFEIESSARSAD